MSKKKARRKRKDLPKKKDEEARPEGVLSDTNPPSEFERKSLESRAEAAQELWQRPHPPPLLIEFPSPVYVPGEGRVAKRYESPCCTCAGTLYERRDGETMDTFAARIRALHPRKTIVMMPEYNADLEDRIEINPFPGSPMAEAKAKQNKREFFEWRFRGDLPVVR